MICLIFISMLTFILSNRPTRRTPTYKATKNDVISITNKQTNEIQKSFKENFKFISDIRGKKHITMYILNLMDRR